MRDKLIKILQDMGRGAFTNEEKADYLMQHDVVLVVRCKDCAFSEKQIEYKNLYVCLQNERFVKKHDFCSYGERRTE